MTQVNQSDQKDKNRGHRKVHVTALYTSAAREKQFVAELERTVQEVVNEAYVKLQEQPRAGDRLFTGDEPRIDLSPYLHVTLEALAEKGIGIKPDKHDHGKLEMDLEIETQPGGA